MKKHNGVEDLARELLSYFFGQELVELKPGFDQILIKLIEELSEPYRPVLKYYFRLENNKKYTLEEIGQMDNISFPDGHKVKKERVRNIVDKGLRKLRYLIRTKKLADSLAIFKSAGD